MAPKINKSPQTRKDIAMGNIAWTADGCTGSHADVEEWRVAVEPVDNPPGGARYLVYRKQNKDKPATLLCCGVEAHVQTAMDRAEQIVSRHAGADRT